MQFFLQEGLRVSLKYCIGDAANILNDITERVYNVALAGGISFLPKLFQKECHRIFK